MGVVLLVPGSTVASAAMGAEEGGLRAKVAARSPGAGP